MKAKKIRFKESDTFLCEAKFVHKGEQYLWGIDVAGGNHLFVFNSEGCKPIANEAYPKLMQELEAYD